MINRLVLQWISALAMVAMVVPSALAQQFTIPGQKGEVEFGDSKFDADTNTLVLKDSVMISTQKFVLYCDELEVSLKPGKNGAVPVLDKAVAKGYVQVERPMEGGDIVAKSRQASYDANTGQMILSDYPIIQKGKFILRGLAPETRIVLNKDGVYSVQGKHSIVHGASPTLQLKSKS